MNQTCKICGGNYRINMGVFGIPETKAITCPHCCEEIYEQSGEKVVREAPAPVHTSCLHIETGAKELSIPRKESYGDMREIQGRKLPVFLGGIVHVFAWIWAGVALISFLLPVAVLATVKNGEEQETLLLLLGCMLVPLFCASLALLFFVIKYTVFRTDRK